MASITKPKLIIGRTEEVFFPSLHNTSLPARVDTGAKTSSIWASYIDEQPDGSLIVRFAAPEYAIHVHEVHFKSYSKVRITSSMGHQESRYKVSLPVEIAGRRIMASFTLSDRSTQVYPILIGRSMLHGKFIVDVSLSTPLSRIRRMRSSVSKKTVKK